jgi:hypothetical protein
VEQHGLTRLQDTDLQVEASRQFFHQIPPRLAKIRLDICALSRLQSVPAQQSGLVGLAMQCQWLAGYAKLANFQAVAQVAGAFETFIRDIQSRSILLTDAMTRTMCQTVDLLNSLSSCTPGSAGSAEGARVMVLDESPPSRLSALAALERVGIVGIGIASIDTAFGLLSDNAVDLIIVRSEATSNMGPRVCQAIRRLPRHARTPILMLLPSGTWERCAVLAMSGATEVVVGSILNSELAMKVLDHFFEGRLAGR